MKKIKLLLMTLGLCGGLFLCGHAFAATYYVDGAQTSDTGSGQTWATAKKYIYSGIQLMSSGDTLIVKDGTYTNDLDRIRGMPSGTTNNYTTIKAETDFGVVLSGLTAGTALAPEQAIVNIYQKSWVSIEGFLIKDCKGSGIYTLSAIQMTNSDHCRLRKIGIKNGVQPLAEYGGGISTSGSSYCLFEDIFICGMMRYGINVGGGSTNHHNILRRVVVRWDFCTTAQPRASIVSYGADAGQTPNNNILMQNCIALDGNLGSGSTFTGGFSVPHETSFIQRYGCISLNNRGYGFHSAEDSLCHDNTNTQCVVWDSDSGMWWRRLASGTSGAYNCTFEQTGPEGSTVAGRGSLYECEAVNNVLTNGATINNMTLSGNVSNSVGDFTYIVQSPTSGKGATILKKMGTTGALWDETGYNTLSDDNLWPFPYEDNIRSLFRETNTPPGNVSPTTNDATRGFCAAGKTLTSYIWEYLGNTSPVLTAPIGLTATSPAATAIDLSWTDSYSNETGFRIERKTGSGGTYAEIAVVAANTTSYSDTGLSVSTNYYYRIRAYNASFTSEYSSEVNATTGYTLTAPSGLTATASSSSGIALVWTDNSNDEDGFRIERKTGSSGTYSQIGTVNANTTTYDNTGLSSSTTYYYRVRGHNSQAVSSYTSEANATTQASTSSSDASADYTGSNATTTTDSGGSRAGCCIATAAFGTPMAKEVQILSKFRDQYLTPHKLGRECILLYWKFGPAVARYIDERDDLRAAARFFLRPLINICRMYVK